MIFKKDIGLLVLILVVGTVVAIINPRFLLPANISNTANQIGLFGIIAIAQAFVILTGGIELSVGAIVALLGVLFIDLIVNLEVHWAVAALIVVGAGMLMGLVHGTLVAKVGLQPFVVTLCALLIYRGMARYYTEDATVGFGFGASFPTLEWLTAGRTELFAPMARLVGYDGPTIAVPHTLIALAVVTLIAGVCRRRQVRELDPVDLHLQELLHRQLAARVGEADHDAIDRTCPDDGRNVLDGADHARHHRRRSAARMPSGSTKPTISTPELAAIPQLGGKRHRRACWCPTTSRRSCGPNRVVAHPRAARQGARTRATIATVPPNTPGPMTSPGNHE